jgi:lipopolysaccharide export LptBFGC system permease protein LptF
MLWTLWRAILIEFWRLLLLSTAVLVTVMAFAATVKPLADGKLTADQAVRFMRYAVLPMLSYTLPFAAGFAATLAYHRSVSDNEVTAAHAGGVSHRRLLAPAIASGLLLAGGLWFLNDRVIPRDLREMERLITRDLARLMVNSLRQGEAARIGNTEIHADVVHESPPEHGSPVRERYLLGGVGVVETDSAGAVTIDGTAKRAWILLLPVWALSQEDRDRIGDQADTAVIISLVDVTIYRNGAPMSADPLVLPAIPIANVFRDNPKFRSGAELREIYHDPDKINTVDRQRVSLARILAAYRSYAEFARDLAAGRPVVLNTPDGSTIRVLGAALEAEGNRWRIRPVRESGLVELEITTRDARRDRLTASAASLSIQTPAENDPLADQSAAGASRFALDLTGVRIIGPAGQGTEIAQTTYRDLWPAGDPMPATLALNSEDLIALALEEHGAAPPGTPVLAAVDQLEHEITRLRHKIVAKRHERWALSASCVVMVTLGAVMAMYLKLTTPLIIYLWSFFPALGTIIVMEAGGQTIASRGPVGLPLLWSGVIALAVLAAIVYRRMTRL